MLVVIDRRSGRLLDENSTWYYNGTRQSVTQPFRSLTLVQVSRATRWLGRTDSSSLVSLSCVMLNGTRKDSCDNTISMAAWPEIVGLTSRRPAK
jgi:hypothetical protein